MSDILSFLVIIFESIKLLPRNGKLVASITILSVSLFSSLFLFFSNSLQPLLFDVLVILKPLLVPTHRDNLRLFRPGTRFNIPNGITSKLSNLRQDLALVLALEITAFLVFSSLSFFFSICAVLVSSMSHNNKTLSIKDLFSRLQRTLIRPLITTLYTSCLATGYVVSVGIVSTPLLMYPSHITALTAISIGILAVILHFYLSSIWTLAFVISVVESSCYGIDAIAKAVEFSKPKRLPGFLIIAFFNTSIWMVYLVGYTTFLRDKISAKPTVYGLFVATLCPLLKIFLAVVFTVLYYHCKQHGDRIESHEAHQYSELPLTAKDMP